MRIGRRLAFGLGRQRHSALENIHKNQTDEWLLLDEHNRQLSSRIDCKTNRFEFA
jgi:hypothetical protein